jgi:hypothetical protein
MPKGEKIRPKQQMVHLPLENFENSRIKLFVCQKSLIVSFVLHKSSPLYSLDFIDLTLNQVCGVKF